VSIQKKLKN